MTFPEVLKQLLVGATITQISKPDIWYEIDGAEGGKYGVWKHDDKKDDATPNFGFGLFEIAAQDWVVKDPPMD